MWDCWSRANRVPVHRDGPLAWEPALDGLRLIGRHLPAPDNANPGAPDDPGRTDRLAHRAEASSAPCLASSGQ